MKEIFSITFFLLILCLTPCAHAQTASPALPSKGPSQPSSSDSAKIDEILKTQKEILKKLEEMKQELYIVKIRATR